MDARLVMGFPPSSRIFSCALAESSSGRHCRRLWLRRSSCRALQATRELPRSVSWLCAMESFRSPVQALNAFPKEVRPLFFSTNVLSKGADCRPAGTFRNPRTLFCSHYTKSCPRYVSDASEKSGVRFDTFRRWLPGKPAMQDWFAHLGPCRHCLPR